MEITHKAQLTILKQLLYIPQARFAELNKTDLTSDQFTFHLRRLMNEGLVEKNDDLYQLTTKGIEIAGRIDSLSTQIVHQPKISVMTYVTRIIKKEKQILLSERLTDPIKGKVTCQTTKVAIGESLIDSAKRCLLEETGLEGEFEFAGLIQYLNFQDNLPKEITVMVCFRVTKFSRQLMTESKKTKNFWMSITKAKQLKNSYSGFEELLGLFQGNTTFFKEFFVEE